MSFLTVDQNKCTHDALCVRECPIALISMKDPSSFPQGIDNAEKMCVLCGHCVAVCPHGALSVNGIQVEDCLPFQKELNLPVDQVEHLIKSRRSIRHYQDKPVEREKLEKLIDIARYAPTGGNSQLVGWIILNSKEEVQKIAGATIDFMRQLIKDNHPINQKYPLDKMVRAWENGYDGIFRGAPAVVITHVPKEYGMGPVDSIIALSYLDIAAASFGLGGCWAGFFMMAASQSPVFKELLSLPEGNITIGGLMIGYPQFGYPRIPPRKEAKIIWKE